MERVIKKDNIHVFNSDYKVILDQLPDNSVDLIITDPPYKVTSRGHSGGTGGMLKKDINKKGKVFKHNNITISDWIGDVFRVLKDGGHCYIMTNNKNLKDYQNVIEDAGFKIFKTLVWDKGNAITNMFYMDAHEYIIFCRKGKAIRINNCGTKSIISIPNKKTKDSNGNNIHDTEKPVDLAKLLIENSSKEGDLVLDPFAGVGFVPLACDDLGRSFCGSEIDSNYFSILRKRLFKESL